MFKSRKDLTGVGIRDSDRTKIYFFLFSDDAVVGCVVKHSSVVLEILFLILGKVLNETLGKSHLRPVKGPFTMDVLSFIGFFDTPTYVCQRV